MTTYKFQLFEKHKSTDINYFNHIFKPKLTFERLAETFEEEVHEEEVFKKETLFENIPLPGEKEDTTSVANELEEQRQIEGLYESAYNYLEGALNNLKNKRKFTIEKGLKIIGNIVKLKKNVDVLCGKAVRSKGTPDNIISHSVNVCIYAIMLGFGFNYSRKQLIELGMTALLHDIGMIFIPKKIVKSEGKLTANELKIIRKHPYYTYKTLQTLGEKYSWIAEIAYQVHERENGRGYPRDLKGDQIHDYAKIIGIADVYEAVTHTRPQRKGYMPHEAVKLILGTQKGNFSNVTKRMLLKKLSCFPLNSYVKLNSKVTGKVVKTNENSPLRPTLEILLDSRGRRLPKKKILSLEATPLVYIVETVDESDIKRKSA